MNWYQRPCARCGDPRDAMDFRNEATGATEWLCAACYTGTNDFLGQQSQGPRHMGDARCFDFRDIKCIVYLRTTFDHCDELHSDCRFELHQQWSTIERLMMANGISEFHSLIDFDDSASFELQYILTLCRRHPRVPLVVASPDLLPWGDDMNGIRLLLPAPRWKARCR
jgi:hypothetical protein